MRHMRHVDVCERFIDYHLSHLGLRVSEKQCQLVARTEGRWEVQGVSCSLPVEVPSDAASLTAAANNVIALTAWQYDLECPGSDIRDVLSGRKEFATALDPDRPSSSAENRAKGQVP